MSTDQIIIKNSAPALCGIKPSNLFSLTSDRISVQKLYHWKKEFSKLGMELFELKPSDSLTLFFACDITWIYKIISDFEHAAFFESLGYTISSNPYIMLNQVFTRLVSSGNFPHEIGLFLGYPLEDVKAFIREQGKNCTCTGYWKSYTNISEAKKTFNKFQHCSNKCKQWFDEGYSIPQIIREYKKTVQSVA